MQNIDTLRRDLVRMGLSRTDTVMIHSSLRAVGPVEGRGDAIIDLLEDYFCDGLVAMPALTWELSLEKDPVFDVLNTPSCVGTLPELFRRRPGTVRSWHPTHSACAFGRDAAAFTAEDHLCGTPCGLHSTWHKLAEREAKILQIGCTLTNCTFLHGVEEWADVPGRLGAPVEYEIVPPDGAAFRMASRPHLGSPSEQFWRVEGLLADGGALKFGAFGQAKVYVIDAKRACALVTAQLQKTPRIFDEDFRG